MKLGPAQAGECANFQARRTAPPAAPVLAGEFRAPIFPIDVICGRFCTTFERLPFIVEMMAMVEPVPKKPPKPHGLNWRPVVDEYRQKTDRTDAVDPEDTDRVA